MITITLDDILEDIADSLGLTAEQVKSPFRGGKMTRARYLFVYVTILLEGEDGKPVNISKCLNKDHSIVSKFRKKVLNFLEVEDKVFIEDFENYKSTSKLWKIILSQSTKKLEDYATAITE